MKAIAINKFGGKEILQQLDLPKPQPSENEVLIEIKAAGVNPVDWKIREGMLKDMLPHEFPLILGWDAAGIIRETGSKAMRLSPGDEVFAYCRTPVVKNGTYAEFITLPEDFVSLKPKSMDFTEAASVPLAALTAYQSLFDAGNLRPNETVLIHAAAGGVGSFAVQMAKNCGARTLGTASEKRHEYLLDLGLDIHIDYQAGDFRESVRAACPDGVDVVFDCIGAGVLRESVDIIRPGGRIVSIADAEGIEQLTKQGVNAQFVFVAPNREELDKITDMIDSNALKTHIFMSFPLYEAAKAHEQSESGHTCGKIVLTI